MESSDLDEMGPVDYLVVEWPDRQPNGEAAPLLVDLVDRGLIRVLDLEFIAKREDGSIVGLDIKDLAGEAPEMKVLEGAASDLVSDEDRDAAGEMLEPGSSAALLVYENRWAAPFAAALRRSGAQLVANGRIPIQAIVEALDATD